jgi:geranylgeranyl diphosphate synthase, type II
LQHILLFGGKRLRAVLLMVAAEAVGGKARPALSAAAGVEIMHNFTLVHDDVMDNAVSRRGQSTIHTQWNVSTAILAGDTLMGLAYQSLLKTKNASIAGLMDEFNKGLLHVCEGQALDLELNTRTRVTLEEYFRMIELKTGALMAMATTLGAMIGGGSPAHIRDLRHYGLRLGRAFQIQDDLLDVVGDMRKFGKSAGGDILEGKRTYMYLTALKRARGDDRKRLIQGLQDASQSSSMTVRRKHVASVTALYRKYSIPEITAEHIRWETAQAISMLKHLHHSFAVRMLSWLANSLVTRTH